jgi:hypothetical protein
MHLRRLVVGGLALTTLLAGCGSSGPGSAPPVRSTSAPTSTTSRPPAVLTANDSGRQVTVPVGTRVSVRLDSTYWHFAALPTGAPLRALPVVVAPRRSGCVVGGGCGTVTAPFVATRPGQVAVTARRTSCGEALRCTGSAGAFLVTVVVSR